MKEIFAIQKCSIKEPLPWLLVYVDALCLVMFC